MHYGKRINIRAQRLWIADGISPFVPQREEFCVFQLNDHEFLKVSDIVRLLIIFIFVCVISILALQKYYFFRLIPKNYLIA